MKNNELRSCSIFKTVCAGIELVALAALPILAALNRVEAESGYFQFTYWDGLLLYILLLSPAITYVIANAIFSALNMYRVTKGHTPASLKEYSWWSLVLLIWGTLAGILYVFPFLPFLFENLLLFVAYRKAIRAMQEEKHNDPT